MLGRLSRARQLRGSYRVGEPLSGYYNDLTPEVRAASPAEALARLDSLLGDPGVNYTTVAQLGLGAWQLGLADDRWREVASAAGRSIAGRLEDGRLSMRWAMPHTYRVTPPWISALTQAEAVSLLLRVSFAGNDSFLEEAAAAARPLIGPSPIVVETAEGPVLQEYPTSPPSHVLNGWIYGLFGLYDLAALGGRTTGLASEIVSAAGEAFGRGAAALAARIRLYDAAGWSRYDLYPHPIVHVASPYYHRLHIELLRAIDDLAPDTRLVEAADRWEESAAQPLRRGLALGRKVAFRLLRPRRTRWLAQADSP